MTHWIVWWCFASASNGPTSLHHSWKEGHPPLSPLAQSALAAALDNGRWPAQLVVMIALYFTTQKSKCRDSRDGVFILKYDSNALYISMQWRYNSILVYKMDVKESWVEKVKNKIRYFAWSLAFCPILFYTNTKSSMSAKSYGAVSNLSFDPFSRLKVPTPLVHSVWTQFTGINWFLFFFFLRAISLDDSARQKGSKNCTQNWRK